MVLYVFKVVYHASGIRAMSDSGESESHGGMVDTSILKTDKKTKSSRKPVDYTEESYPSFLGMLYTFLNDANTIHALTVPGAPPPGGIA